MHTCASNTSRALLIECWVVFDFRLDYNVVMASQSFFDKNYDGNITISDIWISFLDFLVYVGFYFQTFITIFTNNPVGRFLEIDVIDLDRNILLGIGLLFIVSILMSIYKSIENFIWKKRFKKEKKERES